MTTKTYTETVYRIYNNEESADMIQVGPDPDGLDLIEITRYQVRSDRPLEITLSESGRLTLTRDEASELVKSLIGLLTEKK